MESYVKKINVKLKFFEMEKFNEIEVFEQLFHKLCDSIDVVNSSLTFNLVIASVSFTISYMLGVYGLLFALMTKDETFWRIFVRDGIWSFLNFLSLVFISYIGSSTVERGEMLKVSVAKVIIQYEFGSTIRMRWQSCLKSIKNRDLRLKNDFFHIDWRHFLSTFSMALTYLIITIQFELANKIN